MRTQIQTYRCGSPRRPGEGLRIGVVRRPARGVRKEDCAARNYYDERWPDLAPSEALRKWHKEHLKATGDRRAFEEFRRRYEAEMKSAQALEAIQRLVDLASKEPVAIGCFCEDESLCHRSILIRLVRNAAKRTRPPSATEI
jgi:uncharacterized protein YeaO (DUF488 family)